MVLIQRLGNQKSRFCPKGDGGSWEGFELEHGYRGQAGALTEPKAGAGGLRVV